MTDSRMNFQDKAPKIPPRILCIGMPVRDLTFPRPRRSRARFQGERHRISTKSAAAMRSTPRSASCGSAAAPRSAGRWATPSETSSRFIFDKLAHEGIETKHLMHMPGLVTPISAVMIDPTGERTIVTFRDPELWKVKLPDLETLLDDCAAILTESRCAEFCTDLCAEARPARHSRDRRRRSRDVAARGAAERLLAPGVLERAAAGDRRRHRRRPGAEEDRQTDPVVPGGDPGPEGHDLARRERGRSRKPRPSRCIRWTPSAPATCSTAPSRSPSPRSRNCGRRCDSPPPPQR